jgi:hypothetical protein
MSEKIYPRGIRFQKPHENAPRFVLARVGMNVTDLTAFLESHAKPNGWVDFDLLEGRDGPYLVLNHYTADTRTDRPTPPPRGPGAARDTGPGIEYPKDDINPEDVPF